MGSGRDCGVLPLAADARTRAKLLRQHPAGGADALREGEWTNKASCCAGVFSLFSFGPQTAEALPEEECIEHARTGEIWRDWSPLVRETPTAGGEKPEDWAALTEGVSLPLQTPRPNIELSLGLIFGRSVFSFISC